MPYLIGILWGGLAIVLRSFVGRVLIYLGISYLTYQGVDGLIESLKVQAYAQLSNIPSALIGIVGLTRIDEAISVIVSALTAKYVLQGLTGGAFKKMVIK